MDSNKYKYFRLKLGMTQAMVAKSLGITQGTVANWEKGNTNPTAKLLPKVAKLYKCKIDALLN